MSIQLKSTGFATYVDVIKKKMIYFHYNQKCQDITENTGDIESKQVKTLYLPETNYSFVNSININLI